MPGDLLQYVGSLPLPDLGRDLLDILITYYIFYRVALVLKGTRAMQVGVGLVGIFVLYVVAQLLRLHTVLTLLGAVLSSAILIGVVVFQNDIRRGLMRVGAGARLGGGQTLEAKVIDAVVEAATTLARHRTGAIITFEQAANLDEFVGSHTGHTLDAAVTPELLVSLFIPEGMNKLHDGAVVIRDLRIAKAGVFFPLVEGRVTDESFGSRHRAAMGITEETDAVVIVVSEERGSISFCFNGNIIPNLDGPRLRAALDGVFAPKRKERRGNWLMRLLGVRAPERERPSSTQLVTRPVTEGPTSTTVIERASEAKVPVETRSKDHEPAPKPLRKGPQSAEATDADRRSSVGEARPEGAAIARKSSFGDESAPTPLRRNPDAGGGKQPAEATREAAPASDDAPETRRSDAQREGDPARPMPRAENPSPRTAETNTGEEERASSEGSAQ